MENHQFIPFLIGKPSINRPFSMAMLNNQRVIQRYSALSALAPNHSTFCSIFCWNFEPKEGLYVMITLFLVLQCHSWKMFCQRLVRKVGRQLVVMYFIASTLPLLLYTSSPMNCLQEPTLNPAVVARSAKHFLFGGKETWRFWFLGLLLGARHAKLGLVMI